MRSNKSEAGKNRINIFCPNRPEMGPDSVSMSEGFGFQIIV